MYRTHEVCKQPAQKKVEGSRIRISALSTAVWAPFMEEDIVVAQGKDTVKILRDGREPSRGASATLLLVASRHCLRFALLLYLLLLFLLLLLSHRFFRLSLCVPMVHVSS